MRDPCRFVACVLTSRPFNFIQFIGYFLNICLRLLTEIWQICSGDFLLFQTLLADFRACGGRFQYPKSGDIVKKPDCDNEENIKNGRHNNGYDWGFRVSFLPNMILASNYSLFKQVPVIICYNIITKVLGLLTAFYLSD